MKESKQREVKNLIAIYGAIDEAVEQQPELAKRVAKVLPEYGKPEYAHWFRDFRQSVRDQVANRGGDPHKAIPTLDEALEDLGGMQPWCRMGARRMLAIGAAAHAFSEIGRAESDLALKARDALNVPGLAGGLGGAGGEEEEHRATRLLRILTDADEGELPEKVKAEPRAPVMPTADAPDEVERENGDGPVAPAQPEDDYWERSIRRAVEAKAIEDPDQIGPRPCSGELLWVDVDGHLEPMVALTTVCHANDADFPFDDAATFAEDPTKWECFPFWCHMERLYVPGENRYRETVSLDCGDPENTWTLQVDLDFFFKSDQNAAGETVSKSAEYRLAGGLPQPGVVENTGALVLERDAVGAEWKITTTKRLKLTGPFDVPSFAHILCRVGYLGYVEDLICCAGGGKPGKYMPWPHQKPAGAPVEGQHPQEAGSSSEFRGATKFVLQQVGAVVEDRIDECAEAIKSSSRKAGEGSYDSNAFFDDVSDGLTRLVDEGRAIAGAGIRSTRAARAASGGPRARPGPRAAAAESEAPQSAAARTRSAAAYAVEDYTDVVKDLVKKWTDFGATITSKLDDRSYDADGAVNDAATGVSLIAETGIRLAWEVLDAATILTSRPGARLTRESDDFVAPAGAKLRLKGHLKSGFGHRLGAGRVFIHPPHLPPDQTGFRLHVDVTGRPAGNYEGWVTATTDQGEEDVRVRIIVP